MSLPSSIRDKRGSAADFLKAAMSEDSTLSLVSAYFTVPGLGLHANAKSNNVELNIVVDSDRDRTDLLAWFDETWNDTSLVTDVKAELLPAELLKMAKQ